jgi:hypothetical protein
MGLMAMREHHDEKGVVVLKWAQNSSFLLLQNIQMA